ncbi:MAG: tetratricopeptide repeat protein [Anaerolineaceae bacterium]|nr:tetratricopeptide repeat protein [Anaerolineaceae bacterium]
MTKISLRAYIHEISQSIGNKDVDDAIEHCKHILKHFPKHLETYQLLARAYLESGLYDEASDMFLRILSVTPDDFITQVGLSMIMEEKSDIDSAIWHMERAYEVRNTQTIHEELRRLYLIRDGAAPAKPMITRGTLIRINIRSGLYQQALQEIQRALSDDPSRIDLTILKARIHFMQNNFRKTVNACEQIFKKLPYSYEANSLMAEILGESSESEPYKHKLYELNPYTSFVNESNTIDHVPDNAVVINKFNPEEAYQDDLEPVTMESPDSPPDEALFVEDTSQHLENQGAEDSYSETKQEEVELLAYLNEQEFETSMDDPATPEPQTGHPDEVPNWMKQAGWDVAPERSPEDQQEKIIKYDELDSTLINESEISEEIIETEVPEWLQPIAPEEDTAEDEIAEEQADDNSENLEWLDDILTTQTVPDEITEITQVSEEDKLQDQSSEKQPEFDEELNKDLAWLKTIAPPETINEGDKLMENNLFEESESEWLQPEDKDKQEEEIPEEKEPESEFAPLDTKDDDDFDIDSALSWLEGLASKQGADEETLATSPEDRTEEMPDFLISSTTSELINEETRSEDYPETETIEEYKPELEEIPDWLSEEPVGSVEDDDSIAEPVTDPEPVVEEDMQFLEKEFDASPAWLKTIAPPESVQETDPELDKMPIESSEESIKLTTTPEELLAASEKIEDGLADHPTGALDFIKIKSDEKEEEIDEWLKNLPDMEWQPEELSADVEDETIPDVEELPLGLAPEQTLVEGESSIDATVEGLQENDTEFIEKLFSETPEEEATSDEKEENSPYVWENEFLDQETKVPDWISDLTDETSDSTEEELHSPSELTGSEISLEEVIGDSKVMSDDEFEEVNKEELPEWLLENDESISEIFPEDSEPVLEPKPIAETSETGSKAPSQVSLEETTSIPLSELIKLNKEDSTYEIEEEMVESILEEKLEDVSSDEPSPPETKKLAFPEETDSDSEELEKEEGFSIEEILQKAREDLINGNFDNAYQALNNLLKQKSATEEIIELLNFDIERYHPTQFDSWALLGDAYMQQNDLEKALDAYIKAETFIY